MKLSKRNWIVRWAYLVDPEKMPARTNICDLFWRAVMMIPFSIVMLTVFIVFAPCILIAVGIETYILPRDKMVEAKVACSVATQWLRDRKERICTLVELE